MYLIMPILYSCKMKLTGAHCVCLLDYEYSMHVGVTKTSVAPLPSEISAISPAIIIILVKGLKKLHPQYLRHTQRI